jgi:drug/metabolite transporter (DMT)-like permease
MPYLGLLFNALVWGVSWWPLRQLQGMGLHPVWATMCFFAIGVLILLSTRPQALRLVLRQPMLWALAMAAGATNAAFNWAISVGDVVRVVLLFYLMPLWAVLLAWLVLRERISRVGMWCVAMALGGAMLVLRPVDGGWPRFEGLADWLGLAGGFGFALNNVLLRKQAQVPTSARALAMFLGGLSMPLVLALSLQSQGLIQPLPAPGLGWMLGALGMGLLFFASNMALQAGASQLPVSTTSVIMLTEVVFATASSVWLGGAALTATTLVGGALIVLASAASGLAESREA